jgi:hypothetical protein
MPMTQAFVSFNYFPRCSLFDLRFAKHRPFLAKTPLFADISAEQSRDCMQHIDAAENALIVTITLPTRHLDGSHGVRDGGRRRQQVRAALDNRVARVREIAIRSQQLDDRAQPLPVRVQVGVV